VPRFVFHEHHGRSHHSDLRLKRDGVVVSCAVPMGVPGDPKKNRVATRVGDLAPSHLNYTDDAPAGEDATEVSTWDSGTYQPHEWGDDDVVTTFGGEHVAGRYAIFRAGGKNWLVHRMERP
jgi:bifunctional non-homologous end joining protein LigD